MEIEENLVANLDITLIKRIGEKLEKHVKLLQHIDIIENHVDGQTLEKIVLEELVVLQKFQTIKMLLVQQDVNTQEQVVKFHIKELANG